MTSRRSIPALGAFFVVLALVLAGCGSSTGIPDGAVASVAGNPISKRALDHWLYVEVKSQSSEQGGPVIVPNDPPQFTSCINAIRAGYAQYKKDSTKTLRTLCTNYFDEVNKTVLGFLIEGYQYQALAHKLGITVTDAQVQKQLNAEIKSQFKKQSVYQNYLKESGYTNADILWHVRIVAIYKKLAARHSSKVSAASIAAYYAAHKSSFGSPETRNMRIVLAKTEAGAKAAEAALKSGESWDVVAKKYSTDPTTKDTGGLLTGVSEGQQDAALSKAAFAAPLNQLEGPIKGSFGWYLVKVIKITPATQESLKEATPSIKSTLTSQQQTATENAINAEVKATFGTRTLCLKEYSVPLCHGYKAPVTSTTSTTAASTTTSTSATASSSSSSSTSSTSTSK